MNNPVSVGLGERAISQDASDILVAYGLGSCVAVGMVDPVKKISGLIHLVLPERQNGTDPCDTKYVDSGIESLYNELMRLRGANARRLIVNMAGGANMLAALEQKQRV